MRCFLLSLVLLAGSLPQATAQSEFRQGDLYVASDALPASGGGSIRGILRVDTFAGTTQQIATLASTPLAAAYDSWRQRLVVAATAPGFPSSTTLLLFDAAGAVSSIPSTAGPTWKVVAPTGDGRIYLAPNTLGSTLRVVDASGILVPVVNFAGTGSVPMSTAESAHYDPQTQSLFVLSTSGSTACSPAGTYGVVRKIPLDSAGTHQSAPETSVSLCVGTGGAATATFDPEEITHGPSGFLYLTLDDNTNNTVERAIVLDPVTLNYAAYAVVGGYTGASSCDAGAYSTLLDKVVILDTLNNRLRIFTPGATGPGTLFSTGVSSGGGFAEVTHLVEIGGPLAGVSGFGTGTPGCAGPQLLAMSMTPKVGAPDLRYLCSNAPPSSLGLAIVGNVEDVVGSDSLFLGVIFHVDLLASTHFEFLDMVSSPQGVGQTPFAIPLIPSSVGTIFVAQALWAWTGCSTGSPFGLSTSTGLTAVIQM